MRASKRYRELEGLTISDFQQGTLNSGGVLTSHTEYANTPPEPFVDANRAAEFLCLRPRRLLELARQGAIPAHPLGDGKRKAWRFRLSELATAMCSRAVNYKQQSPAPKEIEHGAW